MKYFLLLAMLLPLSANAEKLFVKLNPNRVSTFSVAATKLATFRALNGSLLVIDGNINDFKNKPEVEYVETETTYKALGIKEDATAPVGSAWGVPATQAAKMWAKGFKGKGIKIAVIDTGVDPEHPELKGRVLPGYNAIDDTDNSVDDHGHGTHCSGSAAGLNVGMAPEAEIVPVKFLSAQGSGSLEGAIKAIEWARQQKVHIMSNSWGGGGFRQALQDVIKKAQDEGIIFIAAAGNESNDNDLDPSYPASYPNVIAVSANDDKDALASFSNWGAKSVLLSAPGVRIYSSVLNGKYAVYSGTSMATPHVAGGAALLAQQNCAKAVKNLKKSIKKVPALNGKVKLAGTLQFK